MLKPFLAFGAALVIAAPAVAQAPEASASSIHPVLIKSADASGAVFSRPDVKTGRTGSKDVVMLKSEDGKLYAGIYRAGPSDTTSTGWKHDEFMHFLEGSVKLTSEDGTVTQVSTGDAVVLPKGWKGRWETPGYTKYYVTYDSE